MTEEIIIDGVDVAGCISFDKNNGYNICCYDDTREDKIPFANFCEENKNCYYKQLQRLEKENKELQELKDEDSLRVVQLIKENKELAKILDCKNGTNSTLVSERDKFKEEKNKYYQQTLDDEIVINELVQENEELKNKVEQILKPVYLPNIEEETINKYKQALEEIRKLIKGHKVADETRLKSIIAKIDEVLK